MDSRDAIELEFGKPSLSWAGIFRAEPSWLSFRAELSQAGIFKKWADYELKFFWAQIHSFIEVFNTWQSTYFEIFFLYEINIKIFVIWLEKILHNCKRLLQTVWKYNNW